MIVLPVNAKLQLPALLAVALLSLGQLRTPVRIPPFGVLRVDPASSITLPTVLIPAAGYAKRSAVLPAIPALGGMRLFTQAVFLPSANPASWRLSNLNGDRVLR